MNDKSDAFTPILARRLFVALSVSGGATNSDKEHSVLANLSDAVRKIKATATKLDIDIKYSRPDGYHITLVFLGQTDDTKIASISQQLATVASGAKPFSLGLRGFGAFPEEQAARVIWAGVSNSKELRLLQADVAVALRGDTEVNGEDGEAAGGASGDEQSYVPHITLGRLRNPRSVTKLLEPIRRKDLGEIEVTELVLYESTFVNFVAHYKPLVRFPFGG